MWLTEDDGYQLKETVDLHDASVLERQLQHRQTSLVTQSRVSASETAKKTFCI